MMCCNKCPFHPVSGTAEERCKNPSCKLSAEANHDCSQTCPQELGIRCFLDYYVINNLNHCELAKDLALHTLKTALIGRDRPLLMALFYVSDRLVQEKLWSWLNNNVPRSLWLLNPVFAASGLPTLESFDESPVVRNKYLSALSTQQEETPLCRYVYNNALSRRLSNDL